MGRQVICEGTIAAEARVREASFECLVKVGAPGIPAVSCTSWAVLRMSTQAVLDILVKGRLAAAWRLTHILVLRLLTTETSGGFIAILFPHEQALHGTEAGYPLLHLL